MMGKLSQTCLISDFVVAKKQLTLITWSNVRSFIDKINESDQHIQFQATFLFYKYQIYYRVAIANGIRLYPLSVSLPYQYHSL